MFEEQQADIHCEACGAASTIPEIIPSRAFCIVLQGYICTAAAYGSLFPVFSQAFNKNVPAVVANYYVVAAIVTGKQVS